jgi:uncharacterized protein YdhG (YjbR/CyaY superfamily)
MMKKGKVAKDVDSYLATVPADARAALAKLRKTIHAAAPRATETISYGMPAFRYHGVLVYYAAFQKHCSFFPASTAAIRAHARELASFETAKGTVRFTPDHPLPAALVRKLVRARMKENEERQKKKQSKKR